jgi:hypothetical protein
VRQQELAEVVGVLSGLGSWMNGFGLMKMTFVTKTWISIYFNDFQWICHFYLGLI